MRKRTWQHCLAVCKTPVAVTNNGGNPDAAKKADPVNRT